MLAESSGLLALALECRWVDVEIGERKLTVFEGFILQGDVDVLVEAASESARATEVIEVDDLEQAPVVEDVEGIRGEESEVL